MTRTMIVMAMEKRRATTATASEVDTAVASLSSPAMTGVGVEVGQGSVTEDTKEETGASVRVVERDAVSDDVDTSGHGLTVHVNTL